MNKKEKKVQDKLIKSLRVYKVEKPIAVAFVGLVGSGKSTVAKEFAKYMKATVISGDGVRFELQKLNVDFSSVREISRNVMVEVVKKGGNVVLDSDFSNPKKREQVKNMLKKYGVKLIYIRVYSDIAIAIERIMKAKYGRNTFFKNGNKKVLEMWRRTPRHYRWVDNNGGKWILKKFPITVYAEIDTGSKWKKKAKKLAKELFA